MQYKLLLAQVLFPLGKLISRLHFLVGDYMCANIGRCYYYGPVQFVQLFTESMKILHVEDKLVYMAVTEMDFTFWDEPARPVFIKRFCGIAPEYKAWKEQGIITCVIYTFMENKLVFANYSLICQRGSLDSIYNQVLADTRSWLEHHKYPQELIDCFLDRKVIPNP